MNNQRGNTISHAIFVRQVKTYIPFLYPAKGKEKQITIAFGRKSMR